MGHSFSAHALVRPTRLTLRPPSWPNLSSTCSDGQSRPGSKTPPPCLHYWAQREAEAAAAKLGTSAADWPIIAAEPKSAEREPVALNNNSSKTCDASPPRPVDLTMTTENPFDGREYDGRVFRTRHERNFFIGRLSPRQKKEWLRDHPDRWQTREDFLRDLQARAGTDVAGRTNRAELDDLNNRGTELVPSPTVSCRYRLSTSVSLTSQQRTPRRQTIANPEVTNPATAAAGDEIIIDGRRLFGERRVAEMLGCSLRTLQRWRKEGKGPPSTKIGRKVFYELNDLQKWIDGGKSR